MLNGLAWFRVPSLYGLPVLGPMTVPALLGILTEVGYWPFFA